MAMMILSRPPARPTIRGIVEYGCRSNPKQINAVHCARSGTPRSVRGFLFGCKMSTVQHAESNKTFVHSLLTDGIILVFLSAFAYTVAYCFELGYFEAMGAPVEMIRVSTKTMFIAVFWTAIAGTCFAAVLNLVGVFLLFFRIPAQLVAILRPVIQIAIVTGILLLLKIGFYLLVSLPFLLAITQLMPVIHGAFVKEYKLYLDRVFFIAILVGLSAYVVGNVVSETSSIYLVSSSMDLENEEGFAVIRTYDDVVLLGGFLGHTWTGEYRLLQIPETGHLEFGLLEIGPMQKPRRYLWMSLLQKE